MSSPRTFFGRVRDVRSGFGTHHGYALIEPVFQSDEPGYQWIEPVSNVDSAFPSRGRVHWYDFAPSVERGSIWQFEIRERPLNSSGERHTDRWQVENAKQPVEVIDLRGWTEDDLRSVITSSGVPLGLAPLTKQVALWLDDDHLLGPVRLVRADDQRAWVLETRDLGKLPVHRISEDGVNAVECDGARWFLNPQLDWGPLAGLRNWYDDEELARTVLSRLRRYDAATVHSLNITTAIFDGYIKALGNAGFLSTELASDSARPSRVKALRATIMQNRTLVSEACAALLSIPEIGERIDRSVDEEVQRRSELRRGEIDQALAERAAALEQAGIALNSLEARCAELDGAVEERLGELALLQKELDADFDRRIAEQDAALAVRRAQLDLTIADREARIAELEQDLEARAAKFETALAERLRAFTERPETAFADIAVLRAAFGMGGANERTVRAGDTTGKPARAVVIPPIGVGCPEVATLKQLQSALMGHAMHHGLAPLAVLECHAACLAGGFPILIGDRVEELIDAYAATIAGGRVTWVPVGASVLDPHHLLGSVDTANHQFLPHPNGLAQLLLGAQNSSEVHVVVFEGLNRAPAESWLLPLLHAMDSARRGRMDRGIPLIAPGAVASDDPFAGATRLQWPRNVVPIGIAAQGSATLPLPAELWRFGALIDADRVAPSVLSAEAIESAPASRVAAAQWRAWQDEMSLPNRDALDAVSRLVAEVSEGTRHLEIAGRMAAVLRAHELKPDAIKRHALIPTVVPRFVGAESVLERLDTATGLGGPAEWRTVLEAATRLAQ